MGLTGFKLAGGGMNRLLCPLKQQPFSSSTFLLLEPHELKLTACGASVVLPAAQSKRLSEVVLSPGQNHHSVHIWIGCLPFSDARYAVSVRLKMLHLLSQRCVLEVFSGWWGTGPVWRATSESLWDQKPPFTPVIRLKSASGSWGKGI